MEGFGESMLVIGRVCTIIPLLLLVTLFMGKRSIGELSVFDFIIIITLGSVAGADIAEPDVRHISIAVAVLTLGILQRVVSQLSVDCAQKSRAAGRNEARFKHPDFFCGNVVTCHCGRQAISGCVIIPEPR